MDEQKKLQEQITEEKDFRKQNSANHILAFRILAIGVVLYMLWQIVQSYMAQTADSPSLGFLIVAIVLLGGGCVLLGFMTYRNWKLDQEAARMTQEELEQIKALQAEDRDETEE